MNLPAKVYTQSDIERAQTKSQVVGWLQGAGVVIGGVLLLKLLGWIPTVLVTGAVVYVLYKLLAKPSKPSDIDLDEL